MSINEQIRQWLRDESITDLEIASLLWEHVQLYHNNPRANYGTYSNLLPGQRGYVVVYRDYDQAKSEL